MSTRTKRVNIYVPEDLLEQVDELVGPRRRSKFFGDAVKERLACEQLRRMAHEMAGFLKDVDTPHWSTPEVTSAWVRSLRRESDERAFPSGREE